MTLKIVFLTVVVALLTLKVALANKPWCSSKEDRDWVHHQYFVVEISTTDIVTPSALFFGTTPLQNGIYMANILYDLTVTEVVGFDVGLCAMTPAINNTGSFYKLCNIIHYFNKGTDQVVLNGANNFNNQEEPQPYAIVGGVGAFHGVSGTCTIKTDTVTLNAVYICNFWTKYRS